MKYICNDCFSDHYSTEFYCKDCNGFTRPAYFTTDNDNLYLVHFVNHERYAQGYPSLYANEITEPMLKHKAREVREQLNN